MKEASAPASSANLGPGFDTLALALNLRCEVRAEVARTWSIRHCGPEVYRGNADDDAILAAGRNVSRRPLRIEVSNYIPLCRGLGSSAAAFASGTLAAHRANGEDPGHDELFRCVKELEGHPDNAAAAIYGGLVAVVDGSVIHPAMSPDLVPVVAVPGFELRTSDSRKMIPRSVAVETAVRTIGRLAALLEGLRTASGQMLSLAVGDEIHEAPRTACNPHARRLMATALESGALHACLSGAGPSVLCLALRADTASVILALKEAIGAGGRVMILEPDTSGTR